MYMYIYIYMSMICIYSFFFWNGDRYYYFYCHYTIVTTIFLDMGMYPLVEPRKLQIGTKMRFSAMKVGEKNQSFLQQEIKNAGKIRSPVLPPFPSDSTR